MDYYQQLILDHNKNPKNYYKLENPTHFAEGFNPVCGDHFYIYLIVNELNIIESVSFEGSGCAISKASASLMTSVLKNKSYDEVKSLIDEFTALLQTGEGKESLGKLLVFKGISKFPARVKCANLAWYALKNALQNNKSTTTE